MLFRILSLQCWSVEPFFVRPRRNSAPSPTVKFTAFTYLLIAFQPCAFGQSDLGARQVDIYKERYQHVRQQLEDEGDRIGSGVEQIVDEIRGRIDPKNPGALHPMMKNDGADESGKSRREYGRKDTEALFNDKTISQCVEDRQVFDGAYNGMCAAICNRTRDPNKGVFVQKGCPICDLIDPITRRPTPGCVPNPFYVSELYFPVYQARAYPGRMGSFDPTGDYLAGDDRRADLKLKATQSRYRDKAVTIAEATYKKYFGVQNNQIQEIVSHKAFQSDYAFSDRNPETNIGDPQPFQTVVYQTNAHRMSTRSRPVPEWEGYELQPHCLFHTLDNAEKAVISRASYDEQEAYMKLAMRSYETEKVNEIGKEAWKVTDIEEAGGETNVYQLIKRLDAEAGRSESSLPQLLQKLPPSQRAAVSEWFMRQGLKQGGIEPSARGRQEKDYVWFGIERAPFYPNMDNNFTTPLYAAIAAAVSQYSVVSLPGFPGNSDQIRAVRYSLHNQRDSLSNYTGKYQSVKDKIVFTDKIQVIYPPKLSPSGSEGGERQGSHCFRPESLARNEEVDSKDELDLKTREDHNGMRRDMAKYFPLKGIEQGLNYANEVRIAFWIKRVNCYCTRCGDPYGCVVLNDGDLKEDDFYGSNYMLATNPPILQ